MSSNKGVNRRGFLAAVTGVIISAPRLAWAEAEQKLDADEGVTAPEDLMKEHGVLNRCLLIYEEGMRRLQTHDEISPEVFNHTAVLVRKFVEDYHERNEEQYIFPEFERAKKLVDLVKTLRAQHQAGREVTAQIIALSEPDKFRVQENRERLTAACASFIRMYRPHESREDTVLFPALRTILKPKRVEELGDRMEEDEHKVLGDEGFEKSVEQVGRLEQQLGIYDLAQFTPKA
jgi:hemerythrin-like domain-containing protein